MRFRPCIDIHNGRVKQIVGGSLIDKGDRAEENFVSDRPASYYSSLYKRDGLRGGHVILLNARSSPYYEATKQEALSALRAFPGGLLVGGGIRDDNASDFLAAGARAVIVTSFVFSDGRISYENLERMVSAVGKDHLVLDLSCRKRGGDYYVVTDRWQRFTDVKLDPALLQSLSSSCLEFLIHAADVEGKEGGIETDVLKILSAYEEVHAPVPVTYAGGIRSEEDIRLIEETGKGRVDFTVGSALDLFGGQMSYEELKKNYGPDQMKEDGDA